jgi:DNA-binding MarR family transcriptional regulator
MHYSISGFSAMKDLIEIEEEDRILTTFVLFTQTARVAAKYQDAYMKKKTGLSDVKFMVLMAFYYNPTAAVTASQIAQWTDTAPHNVTTLIRRMQQEGLLRTRRDKKDKRTLNIMITEKGRTTLKESMAPAQKVIDRLMSSITAEDALSLEKVLKVIRLNAYEGIEALQESQ